MLLGIPRLVTGVPDDIHPHGIYNLVHRNQQQRCTHVRKHVLATFKHVLMHVLARFKHVRKHVLARFKQVRKHVMTRFKHVRVHVSAHKSLTVV